MSSVAAEAVHERRSGFRERLDSWTAPSGLFIAAVLVIMALPVTRTIQDPDFWWHLRAGQLIIQHGGLLGNDPFTYTVANHHWTMHEWLNEVVFAIEFAVGGLGLIVLVLCAVTWLGFIAIILVAELIGSWLHMPDPAPRERLRPLLFVLIAATAVSMINPNGPTILLYALGTQTSGAQQSLIEEWFSPSFHDWEVLVYGAMLLSLAMLTVFNRHIRARDVALVLVTSALSLQSARHIALFVAASTPVYIDQLSLATPRMRAAWRRLRHAPASSRARTRAEPPLLFRLTACSLLLAGLGGVY